MCNIKELTKSSIELKILYVEDDESARIKTLQLLKNFFRDITIAINGKDGIEKFSNDNFDLVITDINMPYMNGIEMLKKIRELDKDIPCLILSAHDDSEYFVDAIKLSLDGYILKPIEITQFTDILYKIIDKIRLKSENLQYKQFLEKQVNLQIEELRQKDKVLFQQSKLASMGEMMDAIAHQWKQPLNAISILTSGLEVKLDFDDINKEILKDCIGNTRDQIDHLVETIDEFRGFFRSQPDLKFVKVKDVIDSVLYLLKKELIKYKIEVKFIGDPNIKVKLIPNEFKHIIINLINNSKDEFIKHDISNRELVFDLSKYENKVILSLEDNAGGIPKNIINEIFKSNFTTKIAGKGTGIGLYMSKNIIEKIGGTITAQNKNNGVAFEIII